MNQNAKIIATLGPSSNDETIIEKMIQAGMDVARLNFSHGTYEDHSRIIRIVRKLSQKLKKPITILQDLQGPKLRVGILPPDGISLESGQNVHLKRLANNQFIKSLDSKDLIIPLDIPDVTHDLVKGGRILLDDGTM
jgi:pyruvate kinase